MEDLQINLKENLGIVPEVLGYLASIGEFEYSYRYYHLRHPGGVFNLSTLYVINDFIELLQELEEHQHNFDVNRKIELHKKMRSLINNFFKFYESCLEIIQGCCKEHDPPKDNEFLWRWLKQNRYDAGKNLYDVTKEDLHYFMMIHNKLKHTSNSLQPIHFSNGNISIMGFYLQSVADDGSVGPDEMIHPRHNNTHSANSYNYSLKTLYYCLYKVCDALKSVLLQHFKEVYDIDLAFNTKRAENDKLWKQLHEKICSLPCAFFPNEVGNELCKIETETGKLIFKITRAEENNLLGYKIEFLESGDGFTRSFRMPFYRPLV
jgi:hypothetical protein